MASKLVKWYKIVLKLPVITTHRRRREFCPAGQNSLLGNINPEVILKFINLYS